jgi:hypothetical protein
MAHHIFVSYSHKDARLKDRLVLHLNVFEARLETWDDSRIGAGDEWRSEIETAMGRAAVAILLVSADFLGSRFIKQKEIPDLLKRRQKEGLRIFPVIVGDCPWRSVEWLAKMQVRPQGGKRVSKTNPDPALSKVAAEIMELLNATQSTNVLQAGAERNNVSEPDASGNIGVKETEIAGSQEVRPGQREHSDVGSATRVYTVLRANPNAGVGRQRADYFRIERLGSLGFTLRIGARPSVRYWRIGFAIAPTDYINQVAELEIADYFLFHFAEGLAISPTTFQKTNLLYCLYHKREAIVDHQPFMGSFPLHLEVRFGDGKQEISHLRIKINDYLESSWTVPSSYRRNLYVLGWSDDMTRFSIPVELEMLG